VSKLLITAKREKKNIFKKL